LCTTQQTPILPIKSLRIRPGLKSAPKRLIIRFTRQNWINLKATPAVRRNTSEGTSYYLVRLVFRPYTQIKQTICTLVLLPGLHQFFNWLHHSSGLDHKISGPNSYALTQIGSPFCNGNLNTIGQCCTCHFGEVTRSHYRRDAETPQPFAFTPRCGLLNIPQHLHRY
jgi:hypothetical protein